MYRRAFIQQSQPTLKWSEKTHTHIDIQKRKRNKSRMRNLWYESRTKCITSLLAKPFAKRAGSLARRGVSASSLQHGRKKLPATILLVFLERGSSRLLPRRDGVAQSGAGGVRGELILRPSLLKF